MNDYTPTTEEVRARFAIVPDQHDGYVESAAFYEAFHRWLAEHDRQVKAEAWAEGVKSERDYQWRCEDADAAGQGVMIFRPKNPYLNGDNN